jgi:hypothetical protein
MQRISTSWLLCLGLVACLYLAWDRAQVGAAPAASKGAPGFAVLELFTSEGCSSCPPADAVLADIARDAGAKGIPVYPLSFHVDYWDDIGWRDPWSSALASARQRAYARVNTERVYTPQLVINGTDVFVGSDATHARSGISSALQGAAPVALTLTAAAAGREIEAHYRVTGPLPAHALLQVALVQPEAISRVTRGENSGRELRHVNVVRAFQSVALDQQRSGTVRLVRPNDLPDPHPSLIAYIQNASSLQIVAATRSELTSL